MISITDLLVDNHIPSNYFASDVYVKGDLELGLLENRRGDRLLALPATLIQGIYAGLENETGQAAGMVLFNCGRWWGKNFYTRFCEELTDYYNKAVADMSMVEFLQCLRQCWVTHGWGRIELDQSHHHRGLLLIQIWNSPFAREAQNSTKPACHLEAGVLSTFFSQLTSRELHCVQTTCESLGSDCNRFILGLTKRVQPAEEMVERGLDHDTILQQLCS
ncbi:MAG: V4R domain-containing protein [Synechococcales bacterium]|nr:V4R domain-containing protein [Synechococcales bacterium]